MSVSPYLDRLLRVNLAGETGAVAIYEGQKAALGASHPQAGLIETMRLQEVEHRDYFAKELTRRGARPSLLQGVWRAAGFAAGYLSAKAGESTAMALTSAVEEVIDRHYARQLDREDVKAEPALHEAVARFREEEIHHRDIGYEHGAKNAPFARLFMGAIRVGTRAAVLTAERL